MSSRCSLDNSIILPDGRKIAYADIGNRHDYPVLYFHGFPGSRIEAQYSRNICPKVGVRVISIERPGYGNSSFYQDRKVTDWARDVKYIADALSLERFSILGVSTGGVYALACAAMMPERLLSVGVACTPAPVQAKHARKQMDWVTRSGFNMSQRHSLMGEMIMGHLFRYLVNRQAGMFLQLISLGAPLADRAAIKDPFFREVVVASLREAYRSSHIGPFYDLHLVSREWDFALDDINIAIHLWHGEKDSVVPVAMGRYLSGELRDCRSFFLQDEGHFSITVNHMEHALRTLKASAEAMTENSGEMVV